MIHSQWLAGEEKYRVTFLGNTLSRQNFKRTLEKYVQKKILQTKNDDYGGGEIALRQSVANTKL